MRCVGALIAVPRVDSIAASSVSKASSTAMVWSSVYA